MSENPNPVESPECFTDAIKQRLIDRFMEVFDINYPEAAEIMLAIRNKQQSWPTIEMSSAIQRITGI